MKSNINTGTINTNYPVPGVNNSSQGFRDNFAGIKTNLETASTEISDLQGKVLVKSALTGDTMNNDMAGGQISNVLTLGFRKTTYNLGSNLSNTVDIDCTKADVHWGTVTGDMSLTFSKWAPAETLGTVEVILTVTPGQKITLPDTVSLGLEALVGFTSATKTITVPAGVTRLHYTFSTIDCGTTVEIASVDGSRIATQVQYRNFDVLNDPYSVVGKVGDVEGDIAYYSEALWVCTTAYNGTDSIWAPVSGGGGSTNPGSTNGTLQFNDGGYFNGSSNLAFNKTTSTLTVGGTITSQSLTTTNITATGNVDLTAATVSVDSSNLSISGGTSGQVLSTDGSGVLSWINPAGVVGGGGNGTVNPGTATQLAMYTTTGTAVSSVANLSWASNTFTVTGNVIGGAIAASSASIGSLTINTTANLGLPEKIKIYGGQAGQVLTSDGITGNVVWATPSSGSSSGGVGTVNTGTATQLAIYNTDGRTVDSVANLKWASNTFTVTGNVSAGAIAASSASISGNLSVTANITAGNITATSITTSGTGPVTVTSSSTINLSPASNVNIQGNLVVTGAFNLGGKTASSVGTAGQISIDIANSKIWVCTATNTWKSATLS
jgi:hypothetical protein